MTLNLSLALTGIDREKLKNSGLIGVIIHSDNRENGFFWWLLEMILALFLIIGAACTYYRVGRRPPAKLLQN